MREKELRLALVCFGGVSLAIYMHGVTKEVLKLARASAAYHRNPDPTARRDARFDDVSSNGSDEVDTELVYFELLQTLGEVVDLRVVVDAVAGASAGGINGIFLSRALAHDLSYDPLRDLWLEEADVSKLASASVEAPTFWTRFVVRPVVDAVTKRLMGPTGLRQRVSEKLPAILRVRRIKPPFDGEHLVRLLYRGLHAMGERDGKSEDEKTAPAGASLMPGGHRLETFVTVTDFYGYLRQIPLHDPPVIAEREHRLTLQFSYINWPGGLEVSDFGDSSLPSLAFAARATSSFPGAYPPAQLREVDSALGEIGVVWDEKKSFLERNFADHMSSGLDPHDTSFIDGSVLNNKPFSHAIRSIEGRPAYRAVDRRIVYIDPTPDEMAPPPSGVAPSLWRTLKGALSDIPRNEPMHDDLAEIEAFNSRVQMVRSVIDSVKPSVNRHMADIMDQSSGNEANRGSEPGGSEPGGSEPGGSANGAVDAETIRSWRVAANARAAKDAGYSYEGYTRLKLRAITLRVADVLAQLCGFSRMSAARDRLARVVEAWVMRDPIEPGRMTVPDDLPSLDEGSPPLPNWIRFLIAFDVDYQRRRIRFVIQQLNVLYGRANGDRHAEEADLDSGLDSGDLDRLKTRFYDSLALLRRFDDGSFIDADLANAVRGLLKPLEDSGGRNQTDPAMFMAAHRRQMDTLMARLGDALDLGSVKSATDDIFGTLSTPGWPASARRELLMAYLGFGFWDVITYSIMGTRDMGEFNEIKVDRISPKDARTLAAGKTGLSLKGVAMRNFGAFFSRKDRENDYIFGRMNAAERLIDIVIDSGHSGRAGLKISPRALKKKAFEAILRTEEKHLEMSEVLVERLKRRIADL